VGPTYILHGGKLVVQLFLIIVFALLNIALIFGDMTHVFGDLRSDHILVVLYSQIGIMCTSSSVRSAVVVVL
jgi:hypothetical protein